MPLYEFACTACDQEFELLVASARWEGKAACPHCGSKKLAKKLSTFASQAAGQTNSPAPQACARPGGPAGRGAGCGCVGKHRH